MRLICVKPPTQTFLGFPFAFLPHERLPNGAATSVHLHLSLFKEYSQHLLIVLHTANHMVRKNGNPGKYSTRIYPKLENDL